MQSEHSHTSGVIHRTGNAIDRFKVCASICLLFREKRGSGGAHTVVVGTLVVGALVAEPI